jgi:hypothetical protein
VSSKQSNFFLVRTETNRKSICFGCFLVCFAKPNKFFFGLFRCFGPVSKQPEQTETNRKNLQKTKLYHGVLETINFIFGSNQNKPKLNLFWLFFVFVFFEKPNKFFFGLFRCFRPVAKHTELMVWGIKKVYILTKLLLVFCLFRLFRNTETLF